MENQSKQLTIKGLVKVNGVDIHDIYGEFGENQKCILVKEISSIHDMELKTLNMYIQRHREKFRDNVDIVDLKGTESEVTISYHEIYSQNALNRSNNIYVLSRKGYLKLIKIMDDDLSWDIYEKVIDEYFELKNQIQEINKEDLLCLSIIKAETQEQRTVAVGELVTYHKEIEKHQKEQLELQAPKVAMANRMATSDSLMSIRNIAKVINEKIDKKKAIGEKKLFEILRNESILMSSGSDHNVSYQKYIDSNYFEVKVNTFDNGYGKIKTQFTTKVTGKGLDWIWSQLIKKGYIKQEDIIVDKK